MVTIIGYLQRLSWLPKIVTIGYLQWLLSVTVGYLQWLLLVTIDAYLMGKEVEVEGSTHIHWVDRVLWHSPSHSDQSPVLVSEREALGIGNHRVTMVARVTGIGHWEKAIGRGYLSCLILSNPMTCLNLS